MSRAPALQRHDLVWLGPRWREDLAAPLPPGDEDAVAGWVERGRPAVVRRPDAGAPPGAVALGVALPGPGPGPGRKVGLLVTAAAVVRHAAPVRLAEAAASAPVAWQAALGALSASLAALGVPLGVFGSLAWQHLVGQPYLRADSDADLLLGPAAPAPLWAALEVVAAWDARPVRLDGEVLLGRGRAVAWRELARRPGRVLVKSTHGVGLLPLSEALAPPTEALAPPSAGSP